MLLKWTSSVQHGQVQMYLIFCLAKYLKIPIRYRLPRKVSKIKIKILRPLYLLYLSLQYLRYSPPLQDAAHSRPRPTTRWSMRANLLAFTLRTDQVCWPQASVSITPVLDHDHHLSRQINKFVIASDHFTIFPPKGQRSLPQVLRVPFVHSQLHKNLQANSHNDKQLANKRAGNQIAIYPHSSKIE